jgi:cytochrome c2
MRTLQAGVLLAGAVFMLAGCGDRPQDSSGDAASRLGAAAQHEAADPPRGADLYLVCQGCHALEAGAPHGVGPNLHGVVGQRAGTRPGYIYSATLTNWGVTWTADMLHGFIMNAESMVPGTWMAYRNVLTPEETRRLVDYIVEASAAPAAGSAPLND